MTAAISYTLDDDLYTVKNLDQNSLKFVSTTHFLSQIFQSQKYISKAWKSEQSGLTEPVSVVTPGAAGVPWAAGLSMTMTTTFLVDRQNTSLLTSLAAWV